MDEIRETIDLLKRQILDIVVSDGKTREILDRLYAALHEAERKM